MQLQDNQQVDYTVAGKDAKGYDVSGEAFSCSSSDETVVTVANGGNGRFTAVAGAPGSATLTFSDGTLSATEAIDVVPGGAATVSVNPGSVTDQASASASDSPAPAADTTPAAPAADTADASTPVTPDSGAGTPADPSATA